MRNADRIITETLPIGQCQPGDDVTISHSHAGSWRTIGRGILVRIKPLPKGGHQIKLRDLRAGSPVHKHDLPAGVMAERRRAATAADGPDAGVTVTPTIVHEGVTYRATAPDVDLEAAIAAVARAAPAMPAPPLDLDTAVRAVSRAATPATNALRVGGMMAQVMAGALAMGGFGLRRVDARRDDGLPDDPHLWREPR